jgi:hypothetical protein
VSGAARLCNLVVYLEGGTHYKPLVPKTAWHFLLPKGAELYIMLFRT